MDLKLVLLIVAVALPVLTAAALTLWRRTQQEVRPVLARIGRLSMRLRLALAWALLQDTRVPLAARAIIPGLFLYLALPIDLVPDFIPVLGQLDDLVIAVAAVGLLLRSTPHDVLEEHLTRLELSSP
ncbi:MAG TPA: DUF1232 domain-containing protein [Dehalococcoidia bacterium]|nr:DUF1232 domain-containing protein [Dehalococcoidia bacterium]